MCAAAYGVKLRVPIGDTMSKVKTVRRRYNFTAKRSSGQSATVSLGLASFCVFSVRHYRLLRPWAGPMVSKCANPKCSESFRYLREGRLFHFEATVNHKHTRGSSTVRRPEYFWLCANCAATFTIIAENGSISVRPLARAAASAAASSSASGRRAA